MKNNNVSIPDNLLSENYKRFFGTIEPTNKGKIEALTEEQKNKWANLNHILSKKYPNVPLTMREGWVYAGNKKLELAHTFLSKGSATIQETVRTLSLKS